MAVVPEVEGLEVCIAIDGQPLAEYADEEEEEETREIDPPSTTNYIPVQYGSKFEFVINRTESFIHRREDLEMHVSLNGKEAFSKAIRGAESAGQLDTKTCVPATVRSFENKQWMKHHFTFTETQAENDERWIEKNSIEKMASMGLISIRFHLARLGERAPVWERARDLSDFAQVKEILPKKVFHGKGVKLSIGSLKEQVERPMGVDVVSVSDNSFAVFNFKYRSQASLKALRIIPKTPTPEPQQEEDDLQNLSADQLRKMLREQRRLTSSTSQAIKQEPIKQEPDSIDNFLLTPELDNNRKNGKRYPDEDDDEIEFISQTCKKLDHPSNIVNLD